MKNDEKYKDKVIIKHVDTVKHENIRKLYNIEIVPSTIIYDANGDAYKPSENVNVSENTEKVEERKYHVHANLVINKRVCLYAPVKYYKNIRTVLYANQSFSPI